MGAGKPMPAAKLERHDAELADLADRLSAAAGAVAAAVADLESVAPDVWAKNADRIGGHVSRQVGEAEDAIATARAALKAVDGIAAVQLGHCGLRPIEARLVPWRELRDDTLTIRADLTKATAAYARTIAVPAETQRELRRWRLERGVPDDDQPIVGTMTAGNMANWGTTTLKPAVRATVGRVEGVTPYLLRHTHASLLHYCGFTVPSAAARMGHAATEHLTTYAHVVKALEGRPHHADLDALIAAARADLAFPSRSRTVAKSGD